MTGERQPLAFDSLSDFAPKKAEKATPSRADREAVDQVSSFPSRERSTENQLNIRAPEDVLARFKALAKADRYTHGAFLEILLDAYERR